MASQQSNKKALRRHKATAVPRRSSQEIRQRLIKAAVAEFRKCGFAGATTAQIARRADTTEAQVFRTFKSKGELFREAVFEPVKEHLSGFLERYLSEASLAPHTHQQARRYIGELQKFMTENSMLLLSLVAAQSFGSDDMDYRGIHNLQTYFKLGAAMMRKRIVGQPTVDPDILVRISFAAVLGCVMFKDWMFPGGSSRDAAISAGVIDFIIYGINVNSDPRT